MYTLCQINFLFDPKSDPHLTGDALAAAVDVPQTMLTNKARVVRDLLRLGHFDPEFSRTELREDPMMAWFFRTSTIR